MKAGLHKAVLANDCESLAPLLSDPDALLLTDSLGFTALELAILLGRANCLALMKHPLEKNYSPCIRFTSPDSLEELIRQCPWSLAYTPLGNEARRLAEEYRQEIFTGDTAAVYVDRVSREVGKGLFASERIPSDSFVGTYGGIVREINRHSPQVNAYCFHYPSRLWSRRYFVVDALNTGNEMRYLNHSDTPNVRPEYALDRGLLHLLFFADREISAGEQLTFNYGDDYWTSRKKVPL